MQLVYDDAHHTITIHYPNQSCFIPSSGGATAPEIEVWVSPALGSRGRAPNGEFRGKAPWKRWSRPEHPEVEQFLIVSGRTVSSAGNRYRSHYISSAGSGDWRCTEESGI